MPGVAKAPEALPKDSVHLKDGRVQTLSEWTLWNLDPWETVRIEKQSDGSFICHVGDPEHGGGTSRGTLVEVLAWAHPTIRAKLVNIFALQGLTPESQVDELKGYEIHPL